MHNGHADHAIGVFDSGVGGLTVLDRISRRLPLEPIIYLGDTARVPYGTKSAETVVRYARSCARLLCDRGIKMLVVACNTASAYALDALRREFPVPVLGVVEPGAHRAVQMTKRQRVGVVGTKGTIASGAYQHAIAARNPRIQVFVQSCPLFVPLAEEGWTDGPVPAQIAETYLQPLLEQEIDTLVLGCTHYPLLRNVIQTAAGKAVTLVDSAEATAIAVEETLNAMEMRCDLEAPARHFLVTDSPSAFASVGSRFLGHDVRDVEWVDIASHVGQSHE